MHLVAYMVSWLRKFYNLGNGKLEVFGIEIWDGEAGIGWDGVI